MRRNYFFLLLAFGAFLAAGAALVLDLVLDAVDRAFDAIGLFVVREETTKSRNQCKDGVFENVRPSPLRNTQCDCPRASAVAINSDGSAVLNSKRS